MVCRGSCKKLAVIVVLWVVVEIIAWNSMTLKELTVVEFLTFSLLICIRDNKNETETRWTDVRLCITFRRKIGISRSLGRGGMRQAFLVECMSSSENPHWDFSCTSTILLEDSVGFFFNIKLSESCL